MRISISALLLAALTLVLAAEATQAAPTTWYVKAGPTNGSGTFASPFNTIQAGITAAVAANGDNVTVLTGTYSAINFNGKNITVQSASWTNPAGVAATIINSPGGSPLVTFNHGENSGAVLQGFTITGGVWSGLDFPDLGTGGIYIYNSSPTIRNNVIANNSTTDDGGGICILGFSSPVVVSNTISANSAGVDGGGVFVYTASGYCAPQLLLNSVISNSAGDNGGGFCPFESDAALAMSTSMVNNLIVANNAGDVGGGIFVGYQVQATINNDTIVGNMAFNSYGVGNGGGVGFLYANLSGQIDSCLIYSNSAVGNGPQVSLENGSVASILYSDLQGGYSAIYQATNSVANILTYGAGNLATDPLFGSPATGDYHLQSVAGRYNPANGSYFYDAATSPGLAAGDPAFTYSAQPLPNGGRIEIGAYGNTAQASLDGVLTLTASLLHGWVYVNAADAQPHDTLTVAVSNDPYSDTSYTVSTSLAAGPGLATFASGTNSSTVYVYGTTSPTGTGSCQILAQVVGSPSGVRGSITLTANVRPLGDIDNSGAVNSSDLTSLNTRLNNLATGYPDYNFDLTGNGYVTAADRVILYKILDNLTP